jgi:hypothetical protein
MKLNLDLNSVVESRPVPNGRYNLVITTAEETLTKAGDPMIKCSLGIEGHDDAPNVSHYITLPNGGEKDAFKALMLKRFLVAFNIPFDGEDLDVESFPGSVASAELTLSEPDDAGNVYNRLQLPRLPSEDAPEGATKATAKPPKR